MTLKAFLTALLGSLLFTAAVALPPPSSEYTTLKAAAEKEYAEKSFRRALELYERAAKLNDDAAERRWIEFRIADTTWRADAAAPSNDREPVEKARRALEKFQEPEAPRDLVYAEAAESLGDYYAMHPWERNLSRAQAPYMAALDWWAGSSDLTTARERYLRIVWKFAPQDQTYYVPRQVLVNALQIAQTSADRNHVRFLLAQQVMNEGSASGIERALELYDLILADGRSERFYDDALIASAQLLSRDDESGDYAEALRRARRLLAEFKAGETQYLDGARNIIRQLTEASLQIHVPGTYLPESDQSVYLNWRNVGAIELAIFPIDLTTDAPFDPKKNWIDAIKLDGRSTARRWTFEGKVQKEHARGAESIRIEPRLEPGAYVVRASSGTTAARALLLVTDAHILLHSVGAKTSVHVSRATNGEPIPNAKLRVQQQINNEVTSRTLQTDANGLATVDVGQAAGSLFVTANAGNGRQAWHQTYSYARGERAEAQWRLYAFTDRPAYRPNETVLWKVFARQRSGEQWSTPAGTTLQYEVLGPRGEKVSSGSAKLNEYGAFSEEIPLKPEHALGEYSVRFQVADRQVGYARMFRLEEYKLPEFRVSVATPEGKQYRLGDTIEATIDASYYFGGPVANATVEAVISQEPYYRVWAPYRHYDWYFQRPPRHSNPTVLRTETLTTDANGRAVLRIDTQRDGSDMTYRIEARVVDASRREVRGSGTVRVTSRRYSVNARPEHVIHKPNESVSIEFKALDANDQPVQVTGTVTVVRRAWKHRWVQRHGSRVDLGGNEEEKVAEATVKTDAKGDATYTFTPKRDGYYVVRWRSEDGPKARDVITAETAVWVAERATKDVGYTLGSGIDVIIDKESLRSGETATALLVTPETGQWVMLSTSGDTLMETQILRLDGNVKLVQLPVNDRHVPNFFLTASTVFDLRVSTDTETIVVPPVAHFVDVTVESDRELYQPRDEGTFTITTKDVDGNPVRAEVALAVSDDAVTAIQEDLAGDPRKFFFGQQRSQQIQVTASTDSQRYLLVAQKTEEELEGDAGVEGGVVGGAVGGVVGGQVGAMAEAITVTAEAPMVAPPPPPAPAPQMADMAKTAVGNRAAREERAASADGGAVEVQVRSDFRSTAFWNPEIRTDANGTAKVTVKFPEALTTWKATARAGSTGAQFGMGTSTSRTNMPLIVRLQGPRFFVVGDRVMVSAVINNNTDAAVSVAPTLEVEGLTLSAPGNAPLQIAAQSEARADWWVVAEKQGTAKLRVSGRSSTHGDAMERSFRVYEHGVDKLIARSGKLRGSEAVIKLDLPRERRATDLTVQIAPSLAVTMLDALPYLLEYPYGCTEQTMSRFLPAAMVARTLRGMGLDPETRLPRKKLQDVTAAGLARLYDFQHGDGGWGWWKEGDSDAFMTAYVLWGFAVARDGGLDIRANAANRGAAWLEQQLVRYERDPNQLAWMLHALSAWRKATPTKLETRAFDAVWQNRQTLSAYSRALAALTAHRWNDGERARTLVRNLEDGVQIDAAPDQSVLLAGETSAETMGTAHWGSASRFWWRWHEGPVETTAFVLDALVTIDPKHRLIEPAMNWLVKNRRGAQWHNTRDTAIALLALNDYLQKSGELTGDVGYELTVNGKVIATKTLTRADVLSAPSLYRIDPTIVGSGAADIRIRRTSGAAPIYFSAEGRFVSLEEPVKAAGNELFVKRQYFRLKPRPTLLKGVEYDRVPMLSGESIASGERVEVLVSIETKNDYSYLLFEDLKPAGFEAIELQSGQSLFAKGVKTDRTAWVYQELRDRHVAMFIDQLPQGLWEIRYTLRAEVPGSFHALPLLGQAMYVPDVRANSDEVRVEVKP